MFKKNTKTLYLLVITMLLCGCTNKYYCPENYELNGKKCIKVIYEDSEETLSCEEGYALEGEKCINIIKSDATKKDQCSSGYTLEKYSCVKKTTKDASMVKKCRSNYTLEDNRWKNEIIINAFH